MTIAALDAEMLRVENTPKEPERSTFAWTTRRV